MTAPPSLPEWDVHRALFLGVDGTLLEIMQHPDEARAAPRLKDLLAPAGRPLGEALVLVLVSGLSIRVGESAGSEARFVAAEVPEILDRLGHCLEHIDVPAE